MKDITREIETYERLLKEYDDARQEKVVAEVRLMRVFDELIPILRENPEQFTRAEKARHYVETSFAHV